MLISTILGGVTGLIGTVVTSITNYKTQKMKNEHEQAMVRLNTEAMIREAEANIQIEKARVEGEVELADSAAYMESIRQGNKAAFSEKWVEQLFNVQGPMSYFTIPIAVLIALLFGIVDWLKHFMRPGLTMYLVAVTTWITFIAYNILQQVGVPIAYTEALALFSEVTGIIIYLTVSCVTWWFGDRRVAKFLMRLRDGNMKE